MFISINSCFQLLVPSFYDSFDKFNLFFCILYFFIVISYSTVFYQLIYIYEKKNTAKTLLIYSRYSFKSFYLQSYCFMIRSIIRGMIQGLLI
jgi:hypothetical protein